MKKDAHKGDLVTTEPVKPEHQAELERQWNIISRGTVDMLPEDEFRAKLLQSIQEDRPLRVKQGFDPTAPDIHIGHTVGIRKLKQFQELGHKVVLIVGDYTTMVGDPSERSATRPQLEYDQILENAATYQSQFFKILDKEKTEIRFNGEWFKEMTFAEVMTLATKFTVARLLERDDFEKRYRRGIPISIHELFYPLMQAYDSVVVKADVEIGATEQRFNLLAGRTIQEAYGVTPQCIMTLPLLVGLDGERKMSKSLNNYIGIEESAGEIFGKTMSIPDALILSYFELAADVTVEELTAIKERLAQPDLNPMIIKKELGENIVDMYHPAGSGSQAREEFERVFSKKQLPTDIPVVSAEDLQGWEIDPEKVYLVGLISRSGLAKSNGEARKLIKAGAVSLNGEKVTDESYEFPLVAEADIILKVGKRRYLKLIR